MVDRPDEKTTQAQLVGKVDLGFECLFIIVAAPLIIIPDNVLDLGIFVMIRLELLFFDNLLDLIVGQSPRIITSGTRCTSSSEATACFITSRIGELK